MNGIIGRSFSADFYRSNATLALELFLQLHVVFDVVLRQQMILRKTAKYISDTYNTSETDEYRRKVAYQFDIVERLIHTAE